MPLWWRLGNKPVFPLIGLGVATAVRSVMGDTVAAHLTTHFIANQTIEHFCSMGRDVITRSGLSLTGSLRKSLAENTSVYFHPRYGSGRLPALAVAGAKFLATRPWVDWMHRIPFLEKHRYLQSCLIVVGADTSMGVVKGTVQHLLASRIDPTGEKSKDPHSVARAVRNVSAQYIGSFISTKTQNLLDGLRAGAPRASHRSTRTNPPRFSGRSQPMAAAA
jgi:hypothetical protein